MSRFLGFIKKEFHHIFRDYRTMLFLFGMPIAQILIFGYIVSNEMNDVKVSRAKIINPIDGIVLEKYLEENEIAMLGKELYKIARMDEIELSIYVSGAQLPEVKIGQKVKVYIDKDQESNQEYEGKVFWISDQAECIPKIIQTKEECVNMVYAVKIRVKNDGKIKIGMPGEVMFN